MRQEGPRGGLAGGVDHRAGRPFLHHHPVAHEDHAVGDLAAPGTPGTVTVTTAAAYGGYVIESEKLAVLTEADVLGVISMVVWCLLIIVTFAYIGLIMRADNQGEGGILALTALVLRKLHGPGGVGPREASVALVLGVIGFLVGGQRDGEFDLSALFSNRGRG